MLSEKIFLWIEDRKGKASYIFWKTLMEHLIPEVVVESKGNNSELVKSIKELEDTNKPNFKSNLIFSAC